MIYIFTALECEAKPLRTLESDDVKIIVTGTGRINAAFAVGRTFPSGLTRSDLKDTLVFNIGCCGSRELDGLYIADKITDEPSGKDMYPDLQRICNVREAPVISSDRVNKEPLSGILYDMEASSFFQASSKLISPDRIFVLKAVSDNGYTEDITPSVITSLISRHLAEIKEITDSVITGMTDREYRDYEDIYEGFHASESMKVQIRELAEYAYSTGQDGRELFCKEMNDIASRKDGKEAILRVRAYLCGG